MVLLPALCAHFYLLTLNILTLCLELAFHQILANATVIKDLQKIRAWPNIRIINPT